MFYLCHKYRHKFTVMCIRWFHASWDTLTLVNLLFRFLYCYCNFVSYSHIQKDISGQSWSFQPTALLQDLSTAGLTLSLASLLLLCMKQWFFQETGLAGASHRQYWGLAPWERVRITECKNTTVLLFLYLVNLLNNALNSKKYRALNDKLISEWWIAMDMKRSRYGLIWATTLEFSFAVFFLVVIRSGEHRKLQSDLLIYNKNFLKQTELLLPLLLKLKYQKSTQTRCSVTTFKFS
jgi:hypothetical protein